MTRFKTMFVLLVITLSLTACAGITDDKTDYFGEGSGSASFENLTLHSNEESYLLGNYDIKEADNTIDYSYDSYDTQVVYSTLKTGSIRNIISSGIASISNTIATKADEIATKSAIKNVKWSTKGTPTPRYYQSKMPWSDITYNHSWKTVSRRGCGACALAMAVAALKDPSVTPEDIVKILNKGKIDTVYNGAKCTKLICKKYDLKYTTVSRSNKEKINEWLDKGAVIMMSINANGIYTGGGHYILCTGRDSDGYYVMESGHYYKTDKAYSFNKVFSSGSQGPFVIYK